MVEEIYQRTSEPFELDKQSGCDKCGKATFKTKERRLNKAAYEGCIRCLNECIEDGASLHIKTTVRESNGKTK